MNHIFCLLLNKFVVIYLDNILIYNCSIQEHLGHLKQVLKTVRIHQLYLNPTKCTCAEEKVEFLGHIVGHGCVKMDHRKMSIIDE